MRLDQQGRPTTRMTTNSFIYVAASADELNSLFETKPTYIITNVILDGHTELLHMYAVVRSFASLDYRSGDCKALLIVAIAKPSIDTPLRDICR